jgi:hypothetical protein
MEHRRFEGTNLNENPTESQPDALPEFLSRPPGAPVYHGFAIIEETRIDGWVFGAITEYADPNGCDEGDAFVVAPDGSRAGVVWQVDDSRPRMICPPDKGRWGVYGFAYPTAIRTTSDFVAMCHSFLPELKNRYADAHRKPVISYSTSSRRIRLPFPIWFLLANFALGMIYFTLVILYMLNKLPHKWEVSDHFEGFLQGLRQAFLAFAWLTLMSFFVWLGLWLYRRRK